MTLLVNIHFSYLQQISILHRIFLFQKNIRCIYKKGNDQRTRPPSLSGQVQGTAAIQAGEDKLWKNFIAALQYLKGA